MEKLLDVLNDKYDLYRLLTGELEIDDVLKLSRSRGIYKEQQMRFN